MFSCFPFRSRAGKKSRITRMHIKSIAVREEPVTRLSAQARSEMVGGGGLSVILIEAKKAKTGRSSSSLLGT